MIDAIKEDVEPDEFRGLAGHTLFVEGSDLSIDPQALKFFFRKNDIDIPIVALGYSSNLRASAEAFHRYHPKYYFLIDRDHHEDEMVEVCWKNFLDEKTKNLLIWRRREIENYFLIPEYLARSEHLKPNCNLEKLKDCIRETARERIFLDIANMVILKLKKELNTEWIEIFEDTKGFDRSDTARAKLLERYESAKQVCDVLEILHKYPIEDRFREATVKFFGGQDELEFGHGSWLELIGGKYVLWKVIEKCFRVKDATGRYLQGKERRMEVVKGLLKLPLEDQPNDFQHLCELISARVSKRT